MPRLLSSFVLAVACAGTHLTQVVADDRLYPEDYRIYFVGNSLTRGLSLAPNPAHNRLKRLFEHRGKGFNWGSQMGAGINLDEQFAKVRFYDGAAAVLNYLDEWSETQINDGGDAFNQPEAFKLSPMRDYQFALQGFERQPNGTITSGHSFDAIVLQPYIAFVDAQDYSLADQAKSWLGDAEALRLFLDYASGNNPSGHVAGSAFYIYSAWPRLEGIEAQGWDAAVGVATYAKFYERTYAPVVNSPAYTTPFDWTPSRDSVDRLMTAVAAEAASQQAAAYLIPVGEVFYELDLRIRAGTLPGIADHLQRHSNHYAIARSNKQPGDPVTQADLAAAGFTYIYPPNDKAAFQSEFIAAQGVKNFYADRIHMNNQIHNDAESGTVGAYVSAATLFTVITGEHPGLMALETVAEIYEKFDPVLDADLVEAINEVIWTVVTSDPRTGVVDVDQGATDYSVFAASYFTAGELENPLLSGLLADADSDGVLNIFEYLHRRNPRSGSEPPIDDIEPLPGGGASYAFEALSFPRGVRLEVQVSEDLNVWTTLPRTAFQVERLLLGEPTSRYSLDLPESGERLFMRRQAATLSEGRLRTIVDWRSLTEETEGFRTLNAAGFNTTGVLSLGTPANPAIGSTYGQNIDSPVFFAAARRLSTTNTVNAHVMQNSGVPVDLVRITAQNSQPAVDPDNDVVFAVAWAAEGDGAAHGFLNGFSQEDLLGRMEAELSVNGSTTSISEVRFLIKRAGQFYVSERRGIVVARNSTNSFQSIFLEDPQTTAWYTLDANDISGIGDSPVRIERFDAIEAVGFHLGFYGPQNFSAYHLRRFFAGVREDAVF